MKEALETFGETVKVLRTEFEAIQKRLFQYERGWPPGHFYSPIPDLQQVDTRADVIFRVPSEIPGIDLRPDGQAEFVRILSDYYPEQPFRDQKQEALRYYFHNLNYSYGEALTLYGMLRQIRPRRIVEIGSGYSSCVTLDTRELFLGGGLECTFIEPFPDLLLSLIKPQDRESINIFRQPLHEIDADVFSRLEAGDILFVDSTHVSKVGSDVNQIVFEILPSLASGVFVHFHDIFYPFEYPKDWISQGRSWNEAYLLRAFLQYNNAFQIEFFNSYMGRFRPDLFESMPLFLWNPGSSLWLRKK